MTALLDDTLQTESGHTKVSKTKIVCTLGPKSREVPVLEKLLKAGMNVVRFNFSHGTFEYHQHTLDSLRQAQHNTGIMCAVLLDTKVRLQQRLSFEHFFRSSCRYIRGCRRRVFY